MKTKFRGSCNLEFSLANGYRRALLAWESKLLSCRKVRFCIRVASEVYFWS